MEAVVILGAYGLLSSAAVAIAARLVRGQDGNRNEDRPGNQVHERQARADEDRTQAQPRSAARATPSRIQTRPPRPATPTRTSNTIPARSQPTDTATPNARDEQISDFARECIVCTEAYTNIDDFPPPHILPECSTHHSMVICRACLAKDLEQRVRSQGPSIWEQLTCPNPDCGHIYTHQQVRCLADASTFALYDNHGLFRTLEKRPSFRKCLRPGCNNGQMYVVSDVGESSTRNRMECGVCGYAMCFKHQCRWHEGSTCDEYDRDSGRRQSVQLRELWLAKNTKACPQCGVRIEKNQGCFHMTCTECRFQFCWECLANWSRILSGRKGHNAGCFFRGESAPSAMMVLGNTLEEARRSVT